MSGMQHASSPQECQYVEVGMSVASKAGTRSGSHRQSHCRKPQRAEDDTLAVQIRQFQARPDLRECLLPVILGGVSRKACEGWQRQATARTSRFLAKIKLGPCKGCKYFSEDARSDTTASGCAVPERPL